MIYRVSEIFDSLQGEAAWTGTPMTFVRLQGCDVGCTFCDTKYSWQEDGGAEMTVEAIVAACRERHVCITGGEPCRWDLAPIASALADAGHYLHVETSGRYSLRDGGRIDWVTLSPKPPDYQVDPDVLARASELKYIVCETFEPDRILEETGVPVYLQPCDGNGFVESLRRALDLSRARKTRLSLQTHKILGVR